MLTRTAFRWLTLALCSTAACAVDASDPARTDAEPPSAAVHAALERAAVGELAPEFDSLALEPPTITSLEALASSIRLTFFTDPLLTSLRINRMDRIEGFYKRYATLTVNTSGRYVYSDTGVLPGREYCYVVVATSAGQTSGVSSAPACGVFGPSQPATPTNVAFQRASERSMELSFTDASLDETSFEVERSSVTGAWLPVYSLAASAGTGASRSFTVYDLDSEQSYCFRVRAVNGNGSSAGPVACGKTGAAMSWSPSTTTSYPEIITLIHPAPGQIHVQWLDSSAATSWWVETYDGLFGAKLPTTTVTDHRVPRPLQVGTTILGLTAGRLYCFRVFRSGSQTSRKVCEAARAARTAEDHHDPAASVTPELMTVSPTSNTSLQLVVVNPQPGQVVERFRISTGARETWHQSTTASSPITDGGLSAGQTYCYRLWVFNLYGSRYSDIVCGTTTALPPPPPRNLRVVSKTGRDVTIGWDSSANASDYRVTWTGTRSGYTDHDGSRTVSGTSTTVTGYDQFTYCFQVTARNPYGSSAQTELCGVTIDNGGVVSYGSTLRQVAPGQITFSHTVDAGVGPTARLDSVSVAGNEFTPYEVQFIRPGQFCENNPTGGVIVKPGQTLTGSGLMTLFGSSAPVLPVTLFACKRAGVGGNDEDPMPIQVTYRR